jgi:hypothetical protein
VPRAALPCLLLVLLAMPAAAEMPRLKVLAGGAFAPGEWRVTPLDDDWKMRAPMGAAQCMTGPEGLLHAGHESATPACQHTIVEDEPNRAVITYVCKGQGFGRTELRRGDRNVFVIGAQGVSGREPFDMKGEYRRTGDCATK